MNYYIYTITNIINNKIYIGQTFQKPEKRWKQHISNSKNKLNDSPHLYNSIKKYGMDNFKFEVIAQTSSFSVCNYLEETYIEELNTLDRMFGYNIKKGGDNHKMSNDTKNKLSESHKGKKLSQDTKDKISEALKGNKRRLGKKCSQETKNKLSESRKGKKLSQESKDKISKSMKGREFSQETKSKMSKSAMGKKHSQETKDKMSKTRKGN